MIQAELAEDGKPVDEDMSPIIISNASRYISQLTDWGKLIESADDDPDKIGQVWVEIDL